MLKHILLAGTAALTVAGTANSANAFSLSGQSLTDSDFTTLLSSGEFTELFVAESRAGNGTNNGDYEFSINQPIPSSGGFPGPFAGAQGNKAWNSGQAVDFELSYDALTGAISYTVGGRTLSANTTTTQAPNSIFLRTRAGGKNGTGTTQMLLSDLMLNSGSGFAALGVALFSEASGTASDVDYLVISDFTGSFTLKGKETLTWEGAYPSNSRLATQIKVGVTPETESVPEPTMILGSLLAGAGLLTTKRLVG